MSIFLDHFRSSQRCLHGFREPLAADAGRTHHLALEARDLGRRGPIGATGALMRRHGAWISREAHSLRELFVPKYRHVIVLLIDLLVLS